MVKARSGLHFWPRGSSDNFTLHLHNTSFPQRAGTCGASVLPAPLTALAATAALHVYKECRTDCVFPLEFWLFFSALFCAPRSAPMDCHWSPTSAGAWPVWSVGGTGCRTATLGHLFIPSAPSRPGLWSAVAVCLSWRPQLLPHRLRCAGFQEPWPPLPLGSWRTGPVAFCRCQPEPPPSRASVSSPWPS